MEANWDWRELIEIVAQGQRAMTKLNAIKSVLKNIYNETEAINAVKAILKEDTDNADRC